MDEAGAVVAAASEFVGALAAADWQRAVSLMCARVTEDTAERWRQRAKAAVPGAITAEVYRTLNPDMPEAVARYWAEETERMERDNTEWWRHELPGTVSREDVWEASAEDLMVRYVSTFERMNRGDGWVIEWSVLGAVLNGPEEAYVVYRREGARHRDTALPEPPEVRNRAASGRDTPLRRESGATPGRLGAGVTAHDPRRRYRSWVGGAWNRRDRRWR